MNLSLIAESRVVESCIIISFPILTRPILVGSRCSAALHFYDAAF